MLRKPVFEVDLDTMWDYAYNTISADGDIILASDSLKNLKAEIKKRGWQIAWLQAENGVFSYGQNLVDEYPYRPRY